MAAEQPGPPLPARRASFLDPVGHVGGALPFIYLPEEPPLPGANTIYFPIQAVMLYPRDEVKRLHWFACAMAGGYNSWREAGAPEPVLSEFHGWVGVLWELKQAPRRVFSDGMARVSRAGLSGHVLLYLLRLSAHHRGHCTLERAKALVVRFAPREGETLSDSTVDKLWADFKTVSHLWAAAILQLQEDSYGGETNEDWLKFLSLAEALREKAEEARLLKGSETWKAPLEQELPALDKPPEIKPLAQELLDFLKEQFLG